MESLIYLPPEISVTAAALLIAVSFATSFITAAFGIGGGMIMVAVMAVMIPPAALIPVHGAVQLGSNGGRAAIFLKQVYRPALLPFLAGSLIGIALGAVLYVQIPPWLIQLAIGLFIVWSVLGNVPTFGRRHLFAGGAVSSFLTMFFGATGQFIAAMVKSLKLPPVEHVATHAILMTAQHLLKIIAFGFFGFAFAPYLPLIAAMVLSGFVATVIGKMVLIKMGDKYFKKVLSGILLVLAARLIWTGISGLLAAGAA